MQRHFGDSDRLGNFIDSQLALFIMHFGQHSLFLDVSGQPPSPAALPALTSLRPALYSPGSSHAGGI